MEEMFRFYRHIAVLNSISTYVFLYIYIYILWVVLKGRGLLVSKILTFIEMRQICKICPQILQQVMPSREAAHIKYNHQIISLLELE